MDRKIFFYNSIGVLVILSILIFVVQGFGLVALISTIPFLIGGYVGVKAAIKP